MWLRADHRGGIAGWLETDGRMLPVRWTPAAGLDAADAIGWAVQTFGLDNAQRFRDALTETCAAAWADLVW